MHGYPVMRVVEYQVPEPMATPPGPPRSCWANGLRKYVFLCTACGSLSIMLGALFLTVYFMLKSYTSSLDHFETIPTYVPSGMLIATGFLITCLACRKNRNSFLMKLCGVCSLCCAVLCVAVTVTTTVIHMNKLQTLRECLYTAKTQSCTCYAGLTGLSDNDRTSDEGIKFVFNSTKDCEVIHGALYSCLRAIFGLSVIGILICIFSCMLVYQLLSHEKKKMYWAQLEMRCRYLYRQQRNPHYCSCCDECRYPPPPHELFPWELMGNRFWSTGRIGNLYTPNPENPGNHNRLRSGWNWRRLPWSRGANSSEPPRGNLGSPDSQYGFNASAALEGAPYTVIDPRAPAVVSGCHTALPADDITEGGFYSWGPPPPYASNRNSAENSPARRSLGDILNQVSPIRRNDNVSPVRPFHHVVHHHHLHHPHSINHQCSTSASRQVPNGNDQARQDLLQKSTPTRIPPAVGDVVVRQRQTGPEAIRSNSLSSVHRFQKIVQDKDNYENTYDSENLPSTDGYNTLPNSKKRNQTRVGEIFRNETATGYYFSSAENLGNVENLPPRVYLTDDPPRPNRRSREEDNDAAEGENLQSQSLPREKKDAQRKKLKKKPKELENGNDNVTPSRYRMGIPRSPTVRDFGELVENSPKTEKGEESSGSEPIQLENHKVLKGLKLMSQDAELLEKHGSLMKEFNKSIDKNFRARREKAEGSPGNRYRGIDNEAFQNLEEEKQSRRNAEELENSGDFSKLNETESDVYFGDVSNSSCYASVQNEGRDYEETRERRIAPPLLNKQDEKQRRAQEDRRFASIGRRRRPDYDVKTEDEGKNRRRPFPCPPRYDEALENKPKTFRDVYRTDERYQQHSNDEGSLTADSGISSGRSFAPRNFDSDSGRKETENRNSLTLNERFAANEKYQPFSTKITDLDFSHPLFQKPKIVPRSNRYKDPTKKITTDETRNPFPGSSRFEESDPERFSESVEKSPAPAPRTRPTNKNQADVSNYKHFKYVKNEKITNSFLAPDARYDYQENFKSDPKPKCPVNKNNPNLNKSKPVVPARPLNLQNVSQHRNRSPKIDNKINVQMIRSTNENYCKSDNYSGSLMRRRQRLPMDEAGDVDNLEIATHSVNV